MRKARKRWWVIGCLGLVTCSYYDSTLLAPNDSAGGAAGQGDGGAGATGGQPGQGGQPAGGSAGQAGNSGSAGLAGQSGAAGSAGNAGNAGSAGSGVCAHHLPPGPPALKNLGGNLELTFALRSAEFGDHVEGGKKVYESLGYDLDGRCTCEGEPPSCVSSDATQTKQCDGLDGRDNSGGALIFFIKDAYFKDFGTVYWNAEIDKGQWSLILRVRGYNGQPDDDQVELAWFLVNRFDPTKSGKTPLWDGTDEWPLRASSFASGPPYNPDQPRYADPKAYVTNGVIVGSLPAGSLQVTADFAINLTGPFITARLVPPTTPPPAPGGGSAGSGNAGSGNAGGNAGSGNAGTAGSGGSGGAAPGWALQDGAVAARWRSQDLLGQVSAFTDPISHQHICTDNQLYGLVKQNICDFADITSTIASPNAACDALSLGFSFTATAAKLGVVMPDDVPQAYCTPATDPAADKCN